MKQFLMLLVFMFSVSAIAQEPETVDENSSAQNLDETQAQSEREESASAAEEPQANEQAPSAQQNAPAVRAGSSEVVNLSATIVGNQEQPTVLYIVPWKAAEDTTILYLPLSSKAMEEIFGHVERVEHQRRVEFIDQLDKN